jgi:CRISPR/Cas system type I-B associated protein Csh2 (Cas7 group RAMP superfamily)
MDMPIDNIIEATGLTHEEIEKLQNTLETYLANNIKCRHKV